MTNSGALVGGSCHLSEADQEKTPGERIQGQGMVAFNVGKGLMSRLRLVNAIIKDFVRAGTASNLTHRSHLQALNTTLQVLGIDGLQIPASSRITAAPHVPLQVKPSVCN